MISRKQKFLTVVLIIILAVAIVAGVFGISYYMGGVTFPWEVVSVDSDDTQSAENTDEISQVEEDVSDDEIDEDISDSVAEETKTKEDKSDTKHSKNDDSDADTDDESDDVTADGVAATGNNYGFYGALSVDGTNLVDSDGDLVQLIGVSTHGLSWYPEYASAETIASLKENWGINVIRLAMYTSDYNGYCVGGDDIQAALKDTIDAAVEAATENDMYVIIDWHTLNDGDPNEYKSQAIQFFGETVRKYADYDNVIYEICNEPNGDTTWDDVVKYAKEVIPVIRNVDSDALILVGTPDYGKDLDSVIENPLEFDNVMYTYHFYAGSDKSSARNTLIDALEAGLPVFISECGFVSDDGDGDVDTKESAKWLDVIEEYGLSTVVWNLSNKDEGSALISSDSDLTKNWAYDDLSEQGQYFFDWLSDYEGYTEE